MREAVIVAAVRTPLGRALKGGLANTRPDDLGVTVVKALMQRVGQLDPNDIEDILVGCAFPEGEQGMNVARLIGLHAGLPFSVAAATVNRFCGSSMQTTHQAVQAIMADCGDVYLSLGVESMTRVPMGGYNPSLNPDLYAAMPSAYIGMGLTAENLASKYDIGRDEQEEFAMNSHRKAADAWEKGYFANEVVPVHTKDIANKPITVSKDENIRLSTKADLAKLKPVFKTDGTVTAATSSPLTDGAAGLVIMTREKAEALGLKPLAVIRGMASAGCDPAIMGIGPVPAAKKALSRAKLTWADIEAAELNEAFAAQSLAVLREWDIDAKKVNQFGGAIALGHALGCSGARIITTLLTVHEKTDKKIGLASMCIGGGQGIATVIERL
ncbi:MAG: thiolase family protein [Candidatus Sericytochromatia bacterium]|nr:thiolase family protein [Candidatus Sericytochromatia bacterium]